LNIWITKTPQEINEASEGTQLKKNLRAIDLAALGIGSVVGTGIFVATGQGSQLAGPGILLSFILAAVTCAFCALTYAELACMFPVAGSTYSYSYVAFGEVIAWIIGWDLMLEYLVAASAVASGWSTTFIPLLQGMGLKLPKSLITATVTTSSTGRTSSLRPSPRCRPNTSGVSRSHISERWTQGAAVRSIAVSAR
jgi:APA family basic amino acid/polyamine antiporter